MIEVAELSKSYGRAKAVDKLSFTAPSGRVTGFVGPNGAGKSTTMRMVLGLDRPSGGTALINGRRYRDFPVPLREVGALLDAGAVHPGMTATAHLSWLAHAGGIPHRRVAEVLDTVGLADAAHRKVKGFSLGMRQRLGLAGALLGDPATLILDEPVNGLDPEGVRWMRTLMRGLAAEGRTVFVSSHLMSELADTADRVVVIGRGRLIADMATEELIRRGSGGHVRVASPHAALLATLLTDAGLAVEQAGGDDALTVRGADAAQVGDLAARYNVTLHELTSHRASLEDVFMELTRDSADHAFTRPA
ncbi:ABC transporter ATP-binding protein [Nocardiopsis sediminis]|uniref:ABC transporter ATP-binding protein n=1 Tax=Nocardiopsis sediminis TaxID=1778267 RepID=A0ABV8FVA6_9ACTN